MSSCWCLGIGEYPWCLGVGECSYLVETLGMVQMSIMLRKVPVHGAVLMSKGVKCP